jgi:tRNA(Ile)-lysidine synthase
MASGRRRTDTKRAFEESVRRVVRAQGLIGRGDSVVVAVSGGVDSVVLLHVLREWAEEEEWKLCVAHFDHGLRGAEAVADAGWVRTLAEGYGIDFVLGRDAVGRVAREEGMSVEMAGRRLRHAFLARTARSCGATRIVLGHHAEDQAETVLMRLLRGSGGEGLGGMGWVGLSPADARVRLVRPLLGTSREAILAYAAAAGLTWREDRSNGDLRILRNRVRQELLPMLRARFEPSVVARLCRVASLVGAEAEYVGGVAMAWLACPGGVDFERLDCAVQRQVLREQLLRLGIVPGFECVEHLRAVVGVRWSVAPGRWVVRDARGHVDWAGQAAVEFGGGECVLELTGHEGRVELGGVRIEWRRVRRAGVERLSRVAGQESFDAARVGRRIVLRHWRAGDRFQPCGMPVPVRLQDLFTNARVAREDRHRRLLGVTMAGDVFWVEGLRIGESSRVREGTRTWLVWRWSRAE